MTTPGSVSKEGAYSPRLRVRRGSSTPSLRLTTAPRTMAWEWRSMTSSTRQSKAAIASASTGAPVESVVHCAEFEPARSLNAAVSTEAMGERLMARAEEADGERARLAQSGKRRGRAREAHEERRRGQRQGGKRCGCAAGARFVLSAGDDRDPCGEGPHRMPEGGAVGVAELPVAHARVSIAKPKWTPARVSRFAKARATMRNPFKARSNGRRSLNNGVGP